MNLKCVPPAPWTWTCPEDTRSECFCATGTEPHEKEHKSQESPGAAAASCWASPWTSASSSCDEQHSPLSLQPGRGKHPLLCLHAFWPLRVRTSFADMTLSHLVLANILLLLCKGVMQIAGTLGLDTHLDDFGCKGVFDLHGVSWRLALPTTRPSAFRAACA